MAMNLTNGDESSQPLPEMSKDTSFRRPTLLKQHSTVNGATIEGPFERPNETFEGPIPRNTVYKMLTNYAKDIEDSLEKMYTSPSPINSLTFRESSLYLHYYNIF